MPNTKLAEIYYYSVSASEFDDTEVNINVWHEKSEGDAMFCLSVQTQTLKPRQACFWEKIETLIIPLVILIGNL